MLKKRICYISFVLFIFVTLFIFFNSYQDAAESSSQSSRIVDTVENVIKTVKPEKKIDRHNLTHIIRKIAHFIEFFAQAMFFSIFIYCFSEKYNIINILFMGLLTACCDEFIQLSSAGRSGQISDVFVDFSGCITTAVIYTLVYYLMKKKNKKRG